jgi:serine/threonine-protein kinase
METIETLGKYEIRRPLGKGAMGTVYEGWDPIIARRVAIKTVRIPESGGDDPETEEALARFRREAQAAGRLIHPNIVGVFDYGETGDMAYIVMEYVDGLSVKSLLDKQERFELTAVARIMTDLLNGLQFSHDRGVVHRDIKPANIMLTGEGQAKIADFGIARIESSSMTQAGTVLGTPAYMSPEQFMGQVVDARTDIYSSGVVLYQLLTGERPFEGGMSAIMHKALNTEPPLPSQIAVTCPPVFDGVVRKAMAKRPEQRFASAAGFLEAVQAALAGKPLPGLESEDDEVEATMVAAAPRRAMAGTPPAAGSSGAASAAASAPVSAKRSSLPMLAAAAVVIVALLGGGAWFFLLRNPAPQAAAVAANTMKPLPGASAPTAAPSAQAPQAASAAAGPSAAPAGARPAASAATSPAAAAAAPAAASGASPAATPAPSGTTAAAPSASTASGPQVGVPAQTAAAPSPAGPTSPPAVSQVASMSLGAIRERIRQVVATHGCSLIDGAVGDRGAVTLAGIAGTQQVAAIQTGLDGSALRNAVDWQVRGVDPMFCPALDTLRPIVPLLGASGPRLGLALAGGQARLRDGQHILPHLRMPGFRANLVVDYVAHDGTLLHLYPQVADPKNHLDADIRRVFQPGETVDLGNPRPGHPAWEVGPPYGTDMIIAIASSQPLFDRPRPDDSESAAEYLRALQAALDAAQRSGAQLAGNAILVDTLPK